MDLADLDAGFSFREIFMLLTVGFAEVRNQ